MLIPPEGAALLTLLRTSLSDTPSLHESFPRSLDWAFLQRLARHHRLEPLLCYGVQRWRLTGIPTWVVAEWQKQRQRAAARALYHQEALVAIAAAFEERRVPFILLKGEALSKALYPQEGLRPYVDFDLLVRPESYETARSILLDLGFRHKRPTEEREKRQLFGEIEFEKADRLSLPVDLHWDTLMASWERHSLFQDPKTWASLDQIRLKNRLVPVLGGEALLVYLCIHFAFHQTFDGLLLLCDLFLLLRRDAERTDWNYLITLAAKCRCQHAVYYSLSFVKALLNAQVPAEVFDGLQPSALNRALMPTGRLLFRDALVPQMLERYVKFLLIDTHGGRWRAIQAWFQSNKRVFGR